MAYDDPNPFDTNEDHKPAAAVEAELPAHEDVYAVGREERSQNANKALNNAAVNASQVDIEIREETLRKREESLLRREVELKQIKGQGRLKPAKNWPSSCCAISYHDINKDIPERFRGFMWKMYMLCLTTIFALMWNLLMVIILLSEKKVNVIDFLWSVAFVGCGTPGAWKGWYKMMYKNLRDERSMGWMIFWIIFCGHIVFCGVATVGVRSLVGFLEVTSYTNGNAVVLILIIVMAVLWLLLTIYSVSMAREAWRVSRGEGVYDKVQRDIAQQAAQAYVANQMGSNSNQNNNPTR